MIVIHKDMKYGKNGHASWTKAIAHMGTEWTMQKEFWKNMRTIVSPYLF